MRSQRGESKPKGCTEVEVENVGGIDHTEVSFGPGTTILSGRNATNRSSFLRSIMAAMGSDRPALKADADEGYVELSFGDDTYSRTFERTDHGVIAHGNPYLEDATDADLFAFLLENNEARRAVERGDDLREVMLRPVDTDEIEREINRLQAERDEVERQIQELDGLERSRTELIEERNRVEAQIEEVSSEIEEMEDTEIPIEEGREKQAELEQLLEELREERGALEDARFELTTQRESVENLRSEREEIDRELSELEDISADRLELLDDQIDTLRAKQRRLETEISQLGTVSEFNKDMLDRHAKLFSEQDDADVTDALVDEPEAVTCWTCGLDVDIEAIQQTLKHLQDRRGEKVEEHSAVTAELDSVRNDRTSIQQRRVDRERLEQEADLVEEEIERREERIEQLEEKQEESEQRVAEMEQAVAALEQDDYDELLERQREANQREFQLRRLEDEQERLSNNIEQIDQHLARREELNDRRDSIADELVELRTRVERIEEEAVEAFNEHMEELLGVLNYENIERVWIERREESVREGRRVVDKTVFEHHVVRTGSDGATYEDSVEHLSESEREVIGLVFALAGYLVHELHEEVPFILLDSLEVIDSDRIAAIVDYFEPYAEYLVVALLPEDAAALDDASVERITDLKTASA